MNLSDILGSTGDVITQINSAHSVTEPSLIVCDTDGATLATGTTAYTITLPTTPDNSFMVRIVDGSGNAQDRPVLVTSTEKIDLTADDLTLDVNYFDIKLIYNSVDTNWALGGK